MNRIIIALCLLLLASAVSATDNHLQQGDQFLSQGNYEKAIRAYQGALKANPASSEAYKGIGLAYFRMGSYGAGHNVEMVSSAATALSLSVALKPDAEASYHLGLSYLILFQKEKAAEVLEKLKPQDPLMAEQLARKVAAFGKPPRMEVPRGNAEKGASGAQGDVTAVTIDGNTVIVPVTFTYRGNTARAMLIVDTGASVTTISERLAGQLGVLPGETQKATGIVADGRQVDGRWFVADSIAVGPKSMAGLRTIILSGSGGMGYDGLLGMDFLRKYRYHIDFERQVIDWRK